MRRFVVLAAAVGLALAIPAWSGEGDTGVAYGSGSFETQRDTNGSADLWVSGHDGHTYGSLSFNENRGEEGNCNTLVRIYMPRMMSFSAFHGYGVFEGFEMAQFAGYGFFNGRYLYMEVDVCEGVYSQSDWFHIRVYSGPRQVLIYERYGYLNQGMMHVLVPN